MNEPRDSFSYTYSAKRRAEAEKIRRKYKTDTLKDSEDKLERLRTLDASVGKKAGAVSLAVGIVSTLVMGLGMSCVTVWQESLFLPGICIGLVGIFGILSAYPLYRYIYEKRKKKAAPEILRLTEELLRE